ncbi:polyketide cyclase/dehydrase and lipid transport superfamily protein [Actinidia rufa]|uniref:Polyketide cyclase/dehydrase and lipid transport superfamily protein n=1 Tax=Actinidia rufa TaxID=165716 RepID=A0A7J0G2J9_9ERIC|nr:polyketide cyclase/dehydrase and lipid transport superfamily protein [Actinidia rufa]
MPEGFKRPHLGRCRMGLHNIVAAQSLRMSSCDGGEFFWDDEFRLKWDDMLVNAEILPECPSTGAMVVQWALKVGRHFCCIFSCLVHLGLVGVYGLMFFFFVPHSFPSFVQIIVESKRAEGQLTACEVFLFHHEEMGIPWEIAKLGVRQGMWRAFKKIDSGLCAYRRERESRAPLLQCALMAQINTKVSADYLSTLESTSSSSSDIETADSSEKSSKRNIPKVLVVGGAIALACGLNRGLLTKAYLE